MIASASYTVIFYLLAALAVLLSLAVVNAWKLLRAAIALMGVLSMSAGLYVMLDASFLAGVQVLVYVGGIVVLIVFAVMLTRSAELLQDNPAPLRKILGAIASLAFLAATVGVFRSSPFLLSAEKAPLRDNTTLIGEKLLDYGAGGYVLPFEIISLLLLIAIIGGIVVARKTEPQGQPFTTGGDEAGEAEFRPPFTQEEHEDELELVEK
ncbi:MAG: NADH-quinone oxidoreductase subunit J [Candidatus Hydrogenedentes bacterium]|nr:NADH-quinone oxidoreductase subunit J [Candidatus Hydrogenedentota bacterium]